MGGGGVARPASARAVSKGQGTLQIKSLSAPLLGQCGGVRGPYCYRNTLWGLSDAPSGGFTEMKGLGGGATIETLYVGL
jgi:hypothetical protein